MLKQFKQHIQQNLPFLKENKLLLAISGGVDSVVLAYLCKEINLNIALAHCNFNLRNKESDADEEFVLELAKNWNLEVFIENFNTKQFAIDKKMSTQVAARTLRYFWFDEIASQLQYQYILTAHHADDNFETFLINLSRGTGLDGLLGIPEVNQTIVRPLLPYKREDIENFAKQKKLKWREDSSNSSTKYLRNKLRHDVIPILKGINPKLLQNFAKTQQYLNDIKDIVDDRVDDVAKKIVSHTSNNGIAININKLQQLSNTKAYLYELLNAYGFTQWEDILDLLTAQPGKQVFSNTHRLLKDRNHLILSEIKEQPNEIIKIVESQSLVLAPFGQLAIEEVESIQKTSKHIAYVDKALLKFPLTLKPWQEGDYFYPSGMTGKKKLSKYFKDEKMSLLDKEHVWLLCSENDVVWILNHRVDNRFVVSDKTKNILKIEIHQ
jgi:tRNA(Ile)-lysidine synthase